MIAFPGFAVSTDFGDANGVIQPIPNHGYRKPTTAFADVATLHPDDVKRSTQVYGEGVDSIRVNKDQNKATMAKVDGYGFVDDISYKLLNQDFSITAQKVIDEGATDTVWVGEPEDFSALLAELKTKGFKGIAYAESNEYDPKLFSKGPDAPDGTLIRMTVHPFEEADMWPATKQWLEIMKTDGPPDAKVASLGIQSFSASLLFATAVDDCAKSDGGLVTRACVVQAAKKITSWDGHGLHIRSDLSGKSTEACSMLLEADHGTFKRVYPKLRSKADSVDGFHCDPKGLVPIQGDFGKGNVDPSLPY
jgi:hypothetical protein